MNLVDGVYRLQMFRFSSLCTDQAVFVLVTRSLLQTGNEYLCLSAELLMKEIEIVIS